MGERPTERLALRVKSVAEFFEALAVKTVTALSLVGQKHLPDPELGQELQLHLREGLHALCSGSALLFSKFLRGHIKLCIDAEDFGLEELFGFLQVGCAEAAQDVRLVLRIGCSDRSGDAGAANISCRPYRGRTGFLRSLSRVCSTRLCNRLCNNPLYTFS